MFGSKNSPYFHKFGSDERGSLLPLFAGVCFLLIVVAGTAVDYTNALGYRQKIANAIDAAALTMAKKLSTSVLTDDELRTGLEEAFRANLSAMGMEDQGVDNLDFKVDPTLGTLDVWSSIDVNTHFIKLGGLGPEKLPVGAATQVNYSRFDVELALVVDVTGSMRWDMTALKEASQSLVDTLLPDDVDEGDAKVRISLVPYSEGVNAGQYASAVTDDQTGDRNCVTERQGAERSTDRRYDYDPSRNARSFFGGGSNRCSSQSKLIPLTSDRAVLESAISNLTADGGTAGQTGIAWGWYTLSPNWTNLWPTDSDPEPYTNKKNLKFAVIMTDGEFNRHFDRVWLSEGSCNYYRYYGYVTEECRSGSSQYWLLRSSSGYSGASATRARDLCDAMKEEDIRLYTVYFGTSPTSSEARVMRNCASSDRTFFTAQSSQDLISAFERIAREVQSIYLAK